MNVDVSVQSDVVTPDVQTLFNECLDAVKQHDVQALQSMLVSALSFGVVHVPKDEPIIKYVEQLLSFAIEHAYASCECVSVVYTFGCSFSEQFATSQEWLALACQFENVTCITYFHEQVGCTFTKKCMLSLLRMNNLQLIQYAHTHGCPWPETCISHIVLSSSATNTKLEILEYALQNGCTWEPLLTTSFAASVGNLDVLKYAQTLNHAWSIHTQTAAAEKGHLDCYRFCIEVAGCQMSHEDILVASKHGHLSMFQYIVEEGRLAFDLPVVLEAIVKNNHLSLVQYLMQISKHIDVFSSQSFVQYDPLECFDLSDCALTARISQLCIKYSNVVLLRLVYEHQVKLEPSFCFSPHLVHFALALNSWNVLEILLQHIHPSIYEETNRQESIQVLLDRKYQARTSSIAFDRNVLVRNYLFTLLPYFEVSSPTSYHSLEIYEYILEQYKQFHQLKNEVKSGLQSHVIDDVIEHIVWICL